MTSAIIVAAGSSRRMGFNKLLAPLAGRPVLGWSVAAFSDHPEIGELIVVTSSDEVREIVADWSDPATTRIVPGGTERCHSVSNGLEALSAAASLVAVHDGARPLIHPESIALCISAAREHRAASCAHRITETVKRADENGRVIAGIDRTNLWAMETPQCFDVTLLREAYEHVLAKGEIVTDEVSSIEALGMPVQLVENPHPNPKITFPSDLPLAERLLSQLP